MKTHTVLPNQTLGDISMQLYGSVEALPKIAELNGLDITQSITAGTVLLHDAEKGLNQDWFLKQNMVVVSGEAAEIGPMIIGSTFVIL